MTPQEWLNKFNSEQKQSLTTDDIRAIQEDAVMAYKAQYHNPKNAARAERIRSGLRVSVSQ